MHRGHSAGQQTGSPPAHSSRRPSQAPAALHDMLGGSIASQSGQYAPLDEPPTAKYLLPMQPGTLSFGAPKPIASRQVNATELHARYIHTIHGRSRVVKLQYT